MHTKDRLADELNAAGLTAMAQAAREGYYHDFLSPLDTPIAQLVHDLMGVGTTAAKALALRAMHGDFDASQAEAEAWADTPEGRAARGMP